MDLRSSPSQECTYIQYIYQACFDLSATAFLLMPGLGTLYVHTTECWKILRMFSPGPMAKNSHRAHVMPYALYHHITHLHLHLPTFTPPALTSALFPWLSSPMLASASSLATTYLIPNSKTVLSRALFSFPLYRLWCGAV